MLTMIGVPDVQTLLLKSRKMSEAREKEGVEVVWSLWARNDASRKDIPYFVLFIRCKINEDPYVDPAAGLLILIELGTVNR